MNQLKDEKLAPTLGRTPLTRLRNVYSTLFKSEFGFEPDVYLAGVDGGILKKLLNEYGEVGGALRIMLYFKDLGDAREYRKIVTAAFPLRWLPSNLNKINVWLAQNKKAIPDELEFAAGMYRQAKALSRLSD
jgi:hypothetical protein